MIKDMKVITFTYSHTSMSEVKDMVDEFCIALGSNLRINDMFYYGVFCKPSTYANYQHWDEVNDIEIPNILSEGSIDCKIKEKYVDEMITQVLVGNESKPDWMFYIEMEIDAGGGYPPSTFLYLIPKEEKYKRLGERITSFLYSPQHKTVKK